MRTKKSMALLLLTLTFLLPISCGKSGDTSSAAGESSSALSSSELAGSEYSDSSLESLSSSSTSPAHASKTSTAPGAGNSSASTGSGKPDTGSKVPKYPTVKEDPKLLEDAVATWDFTDGGTTGNIKSALKGGANGTHRWGVWLNDFTFGKVLDFSTEGSYFKAPANNVALGSSFTIAAWVKLPKRENNTRVIIAQGTSTQGWQLRVEKDTRKLIFQATGLTGSTDSGKTLGDGKWHHVMVTYDGFTLTYYVDGSKVKSQAVSGSVVKLSSDIYVGSDSAGENGLDGSVSRVRIYNKVKTPAQVTSIKAPNSANELSEPVLKLKKGIVLDRRQYAGPVPPENEKVYEEDVANCINMGFDHMKVLLTPNHIINSDGSLKVENMKYITRVLNDVVEQGINCILCIHPEVPFKQTYLVEGPQFEKLIKWYGQLAAYIGERWSADQVALQLMTEPYANSPESRWTWMSDRMWGAVRNVLPDHTIITSSDRSGNLERLKLMSPTSDSNLIYSFTTYEPYTIGFNIARTGMGGNVSFWNYLKDIPYPASPDILNAQRIQDVISLVPSNMKSQAQAAMEAYASGKNDGGDTNFANQYSGTYYGTEWHMKRAKSLDDWRKKYGGNIHIMCVEFGCMDSVTGVSTFKGAQGAGLSAQTRIKFIGDLRRSFEAYNIGWSYWSYNEPFTVFLPDKRIPGFSPEPNKLAPKWYDRDLLINALGVTPKK